MKDIYNAYVKKLKEETKFDKNKNQTVLVNPWAKTKPQEFWDECWSKIERSGLQFDGNHITINQNGVSYDYVAYKNKMLLAYPESKIDEGIVYKGDSFAFEKTNGAVDYKHILANPFNHKDDDIVGGYCVIKNKRGEFITTLSKEEINKARSVAKTDTIWKQWFAEMCRKTVIKKAVKFHFDDIYSEMEEEDNKNYDLEQTEEKQLPEALINALNEAKTYEEVKAIYKRENNNLEGAELKAKFLYQCQQRKEELNNASA